MKIEYDGHRMIIPEPTCSCTHHRPIACEIYIGNNILPNMPGYIKQTIGKKNGLLITDHRLYHLFGRKVIEVLKNDFIISVCVPNEDGQLKPDQYALGEVMMSLDNDTEFLIALGSGTVNDITRYVANHCNLPFVSIGTAPSMDGYLSVVAPMLKDDLKINKPAKYPDVCIFDIEIMKTAPAEMLFAGFGDVIGKFIAKADWILGHHINNEPICPFCLELDDMAMKLCQDNLQNILEKNCLGVTSLLEALLLTGLAMLLNGDSRPAASNEHNMGHFIEMKKLQARMPHPSHGEAVGISTLYCLELYQKLLSYDISRFSFDHLASADSHLSRENQILSAYGKEIGKAILEGNKEEPISSEERSRRIKTFFMKHEEIKASLSFLPSVKDIKAMFASLDGPITASDILVDDVLLKQALLYAKDYRSRYNSFKLADELGVLDEFIDDMVPHELR